MTKNEQPNLIRLMQIAYNAGQLQADENNVLYTPEWKEYYKKHHLDSYLSFMTPYSLKKMNEKLELQHPIFDEIDLVSVNTETTQSGGYRYKYQKYVRKVNLLKF